MIGAGTASGDGYGYATVEIVPDNNLYNNHQYLVVDPTSPNHIHIRAGGDVDNSNAELIFGGEASNFKVTSGQNPYVYITSNNNTWQFSTDGMLYLPYNGEIRDNNGNNIVSPRASAINNYNPDVTCGVIRVQMNNGVVTVLSYNNTGLAASYTGRKISVNSNSETIISSGGTSEIGRAHV